MVQKVMFPLKDIFLKSNHPFYSTKTEYTQVLSTIKRHKFNRFLMSFLLKRTFLQKTCKFYQFISK